MQVAEDGHLVVDIDAHYYENPRAFAQYLDEPWRSRLANWSGAFFAPVSGRAQTIDRNVGGRLNRHPDAGFPSVDSPDGIRRVMRYLGVDVIVMLPESLLTVGEITDKPRAVAYCNGYIDHMLEDVVCPQEGIYTLIVAPNQSPPDAVELIDRRAKHDGVCGVAMMTDGPVLPYGDSYYDPIYDACVRNGLPLVFHSGYGGSEGRESGLGLQTYVENHLAFVINNQIQLTSFVLQGVPERFPDLKVVWQEAGVFWIPLMMYRLDTDYSMLRSQAPWLKRPPSDYIKDMFFGTQPLERVPSAHHLRPIFELIGAEERLMFATDWPHRDFDDPVAIRRLPFLDDAGKRRILGDNARAVLRFNGLGRTGHAAAEAGA